MKCVQCEQEMETKTVKGVEIDLCPSCAGVWLDGGELKEITKYDLSAGRVLTCLKCDKPMQTKMVRGVEVDICPDCNSVWLDAGELAKVAGLDHSAGRVLECPKCENQLQTKMLKGVEVDICPQCTGAYLDKGEMQKLAAVEHDSGAGSDIAQFLHDANKLRIDVAIRSNKNGTHDKGKAAEIAGLTIEEFEDLLKD